MEVLCSNCGTRLKVPDEKIPDKGRITANCPKCNSRISFEKPRDDSELSSVQETPDSDSAMTEHGSDYRDEDPFSLEFYEEGAKLCLLMLNDSNIESVIREAAEGLLYKTVWVQSAGESINKMRFHQFDLIIISEHFETVGWEQSPILHYLNRLPMYTRRGSFLVLVGKDFSTMDRMRAFALSADLVVNPNDMHEFAGILKAALWSHANFYGAFTDTLQELGKI